MSGVVHIDIVPQMTVVEDERSLGECRPHVPEHAMYRIPLAVHTSSLDPSLGAVLSGLHSLIWGFPINLQRH
jgi:hypothetical protein